MSCTTKHRNMFQNIQPARNEDHYYYAGKYYYNKVPHHTESHRPLESCNRSYNKSNNVRFSKTNTSSHIKTSSSEGLDFGKVAKLWEKLAVSESKLELMGRMIERNIGFNDIEEFVNKIERKTT